MSEALMPAAEQKEGTAIWFLRGFAWINLLASTGAAIYIWSTMATTQISSSFGTYHESNPLGIVIGIAFLAEGLIGCALLLTVCAMAENLIAIRKATVKDLALP